MIGADQKSHSGTDSPRTGMGLALVAHTGFGLYVVFVKCLLEYLPPFRMLAVAFTVALPLILLVIYRTISWRAFGRWEMWLLAGLALGRSVTKLLGLQFTYAVYVQLIDMAVPVLTPILAWLLLREKMPSSTLPAIVATSIGSFLVVTVDPFHMSLPNGLNDLIGIGFAFMSALLMTLGVVYTRKLTTSRQPFRPESLFLAQVFLVGIAYWGLSAVAVESWEPFMRADPWVWAVFALFIVLSLVAAGLTQIQSISRVKAALFSALLSWRLAVAVIAAWILLGERLVSIWQVGGVMIVIGTITVYVRRQTSAASVLRDRVLD